MDTPEVALLKEQMVIIERTCEQARMQFVEKCLWQSSVVVQSGIARHGSIIFLI